MTKPTQTVRRERSAFTLLEMIAVIMIIGVLAALLFPVGAAIKKSATIKKAQSELKQVALAIESYKMKYGYYPPDNYPCNGGSINPLYFELVGTELKNGSFQTLDGSASIADTDAAFINAFGQVAGKPCVRGFANCAKGANTDDAIPAVPFLKGLKPAQYGYLISSPTVRLLVCSVAWPVNKGAVIPGVSELNPWRYVSSNPTNNLGTYDLWVNIVIGSVTNRISNWSEQPQLVDAP